MGKYVRQNLRSNEAVVYETKLHWIVYLSGFILVALGILWSAVVRDASVILGIALIALGLMVLLDAWIRRVTTEFAVTDKRVIIKLGLIWRKTLEMNLSRVESLEVSQGILGRIFGYGKVVVIGTGGTKEAFSRIEDPLNFRKAVQLQIK